VDIFLSWFAVNSANHSTCMSLDTIYIYIYIYIYNHFVRTGALNVDLCIKGKMGCPITLEIGTNLVVERKPVFFF
jgi:hypothetical protein